MEVGAELESPLQLADRPLCVIQSRRNEAGVVPPVGVGSVEGKGSVGCRPRLCKSPIAIEGPGIGVVGKYVLANRHVGFSQRQSVGGWPLVIGQEQ